MKKIILGSSLAFLGICFIGSQALAAPATTTGSRLAIFRVYNPNSGEHLFTPRLSERDLLVNLGWKDEGTACYVPYEPHSNKNYAYRLYNPNVGDHHYTINFAEVQNLVKLGWQEDHIGFYTADEGEPMYRLYNPNVKVGFHHFTMSETERAALIKAGWQAEGIAYTAYSTAAAE